jgi:hypothetical protein
MRVLGRLQTAIEDLHAVETDLDVRAYVVDDETRRSIPGAREGLPEQLFVREAQDGLELALYIDPAVVARLENDRPHRRLHDGNIESFCIALEGVSHFVLLAWRARIGRPISPLELEIQAEVDKFVLAWLLLARQGQRLDRTAPRLARQLFERFELRDAVPPAEASRYETANRVAKEYCRSLALRFGLDRNDRRIRRDVRRYYRRGLAEKMRST